MFDQEWCAGPGRDRLLDSLPDIGLGMTGDGGASDATLATTCRRHTDPTPASQIWSRWAPAWSTPILGPRLLQQPGIEFGGVVGVIPAVVADSGIFGVAGIGAGGFQSGLHVAGELYGGLAVFVPAEVPDREARVGEFFGIADFAATTHRDNRGGKVGMAGGNGPGAAATHGKTSDIDAIGVGFELGGGLTQDGERGLSIGAVHLPVAVGAALGEYCDEGEGAFLFPQRGSESDHDLIDAVVAALAGAVEEEEQGRGFGSIAFVRNEENVFAFLFRGVHEHAAVEAGRR